MKSDDGFDDDSSKNSSLQFDDDNDYGKPSTFQFEHAHSIISQWSTLQTNIYTVFIALSIALADSIPTLIAMYGRQTKQELLYALRGGLSKEDQQIMAECDVLLFRKKTELTLEETELLSKRPASLIILNRKLGVLAEQLFPEEWTAKKVAMRAK